jgi:hypothetical protein
MAYLGVPYKIAYIAENFRTGLTDIIAMVELPDGTVCGPFDFTESLGVGFGGIYTAIYTPHTYSPEGQYLALVISPTERVRSLIKFEEFVRPPLQVETNIQNFGSVIEVTPVLENVNVTLEPNETNVVEIDNNIVSVEIIPLVQDVIINPETPWEIEE